MTHGEHGEELSPSSSAPESETLLSMPTNRAYSDAIYDNGYDITRSGPIIETVSETPNFHALRDNVCRCFPPCFCSLPHFYPSNFYLVVF